MTPRDIEIFAAHLQRFASGMRCPVCSGEQWVIEGPAFMVKPKDGAMSGELVGSATISVGLAICNKCFFVNHFAWAGVEALADESLKLVPKPKQP